jgi:hypothetical protein
VWENSERDGLEVRAPALPAQPIPGGRFRKGGEAPLRVSRPEFSKIMRDMNARVKADMAAKAGGESRKH